MSDDRVPATRRIAPPSLRVPREPISAERVARLLALVSHEAREAGTRRAIARSDMSMSQPFPVVREEVEALPIAVDHDDRPYAADREPCPLCAVRGDIGCQHRRPFTTGDEPR